MAEKKEEEEVVVVVLVGRGQNMQSFDSSYGYANKGRD